MTSSRFSALTLMVNLKCIHRTKLLIAICTKTPYHIQVWERSTRTIYSILQQWTVIHDGLLDRFLTTASNDILTEYYGISAGDFFPVFNLPAVSLSYVNTLPARQEIYVSHRSGTPYVHPTMSLTVWRQSTCTLHLSPGKECVGRLWGHWKWAYHSRQRESHLCSNVQFTASNFMAIIVTLT